MTPPIRLFSAFFSGPVAGSGGSLGAWLSAWLRSRFHPIGLAAIYAGCLVLSVALTADFAIAWSLRSLWLALVLAARARESGVARPGGAADLSPSPRQASA